MTHRMILAAAAALAALLSACELAYFVREPRRRVHEPPPVHDPSPPPPAGDDDPYMERGEKASSKAPAESLQPVVERDTRTTYVPGCSCGYCGRARSHWGYSAWSYGVSWSRRGWGWGIGWGW